MAGVNDLVRWAEVHDVVVYACSGIRIPCMAAMAYERSAVAVCVCVLEVVGYYDKHLPACRRQINATLMETVVP